MAKIKAAVAHEFGAPLVVEEVDLREPQGSELEVTLEACAICHSDITFADGGWGGTLPAVYGHEAVGRVTGTGPSARITLGERVVVTLIRACGTCTSCATGKPTICETPVDGDAGPLTTVDGGVLHQAMACGAFAEKVVVEEAQVVPIGEDMPAASAALLSCGVITGVGAVVYAGDVRAGQDVVVIGAGGVGLNAIQGARIAGARRIVAVDMVESKLEDAKTFGATDVVLASEPSPWRAAKAAMGRGADAVLVTVGVGAVYSDAPKYLARGGRVVMVGMPHGGDTSAYEASMIAAVGQALVGSKMGDVVISRDIPWLADLYRQGRLKLDELVSRSWSLDQINEAIADTKAGAARRNVIVF